MVAVLLEFWKGFVLVRDRYHAHPKPARSCGNFDRENAIARDQSEFIHVGG
jgi:hypothetical protein